MGPQDETFGSAESNNSLQRPTLEVHSQAQQATTTIHLFMFFSVPEQCRTIQLDH
jgi:hypothetical protein